MDGVHYPLLLVLKVYFFLFPTGCLTGTNLILLELTVSIVHLVNSPSHCVEFDSKVEVVHQSDSAILTLLSLFLTELESSLPCFSTIPLGHLEFAEISRTSDA